MIVNNTNYRAIGKWLYNNWEYVDKATSYNQLANLVNTKIANESIPNVNPQIKLQVATLSTIIYAVQGVKDVNNK